MSDDSNILIFSEGSDTNVIANCGNLGCGFNVAGKCTATGSKCFGFIEAEVEDEDE